YRTHNSGIFGPGTGPAQLLAGQPLVHVPDLIATEAYRQGDPDRRALVDLGGARSALNVPLLRDRMVVGYIMIYRQEAKPFTEKQIGLLKNFAGQAVIAMENARSSPRRARPWNSSPQPPRYCKSSTPRPANFSLCSTRCWKGRCALLVRSRELDRI